MYKAKVESEKIPTTEIEENTPLGSDLVWGYSNETVVRGQVQQVAEIALSTTEVLEMLMFEPTYVKIGALVVKVCREREWYKVESEQKPESEDKDEQVENPTYETLLENVKTEEGAEMEIKKATNAHPDSNSSATTGLQVEESIKVKDDKKTKLEAETFEEKAKPRIKIETTTTTAEAEVHMTPESTWSMHSSQFKNLLFISSKESTWSTESTMSKGSKGSNEFKESKGSKGSKRSTRFNRCTGSIGTTGSTEAKLEENIVLETKM